MSSIRVIAGVIFFCVGIAAAITGNMFTTMMISEINRQRKEDNQISYLGFTPPKTLKIFSEYRRLYPQGRLRHYADASFIAMMIALVITAVCFHVIG
jgi:hypothetical protein